MVGTDTLPVRELVVEDLPQAVGLSTAVGWNQVEADWRTFLELGHAVAVDDAEGRLAATAATLPLGSDFAWISMVIVRPDHRRRGIATTLLERCADEITSTGMIPGLDATPAGREVYLRLGFEDGWPLARWRRTHGREPLLAAEPPASLRIRPVEVGDMPCLERLDSAAFGVQRMALLGRLRARSTSFAAVAEGEAGVCGFVLGRNGRTATHLGPLVAASGPVACALARHAVAEIAGGVTIDVADAASELRRWLGGSGFTQERPFMRMYRGGAGSPGDPGLARAIAGPELG